MVALGLSSSYIGATNYVCSSRPNNRITCKSSADFYQILSLKSLTATKEEIKKAYRSMALKYHPDVCTDPECTQMFVQLRRAYETLSDPNHRRTYDTCLMAPSRNNEFPRERWEVQIRDLKVRSERREKEKKGFQVD